MRNKDIFNFRRFGKYFDSDFRTCASEFGLNIVGIVVLTNLGMYIFHGIFGLIFEQEWMRPQIATRIIAFAAVLASIIIFFPVKCYGRLTEKQYGSFWLTIPASGFEKFLSMTLMTILAPALVGILHTGIDAVMCGLDPVCGNSIIREMTGWAVNTREVISEEIIMSGSANLSSFTKQITSPWLYIDDCIGMTLALLRGALVFKNGKTVKTFIALAAFGIAASIVAIPLTMQLGKPFMELQMNTMTDMDSFFNMGIFRHVALYDTINDTIVNLALLVAIYFRIKTLKH